MDDIINEFGEIDFSRPVSNNYWLNQLQNSLAFLDSVSFFDIDFDNDLDFVFSFCIINIIHAPFYVYQ